MRLIAGVELVNLRGKLYIRRGHKRTKHPQYGLSSTSHPSTVKSTIQPSHFAGACLQIFKDGIANGLRSIGRDMMKIVCWSSCWKRNWFMRKCGRFVLPFEDVSGTRWVVFAGVEYK